MISIRIGVWEHRLGKVWNQLLTSKQLEYHNSKQKQRVGLQNKPEQTYDRDFAQSVRDEAPGERRTADVTNDKQDVPESA